MLSMSEKQARSFMVGVQCFQVTKLGVLHSGERILQFKIKSFKYGRIFKATEAQV